jgi:hypothetical protein
MKPIFCLPLFLLIGCSIAEGPVYFVQSRENEEILRNVYPSRDTLFLKYYSLGTWNERVGLGGRRLGEELSYSHDTIWANIVKAMKRTNIPIAVSDTPQQFDIVDWYKSRKDPEKFKAAILSQMDSSDFSKVYIVPIVGYYSGWGNELNPGLVSGAVSPSGRFEHSLSYSVSICVLQNRDLLYYSGTKKVDTLTRFPDEPYQYHFPQQLWDTLMYISTRDYVERMR